MTVDMHTHIGSPLLDPGGGERERAAGAVKLFAKHGITRALVMTTSGLLSSCSDQKSDNDKVFNYCRQAPDVLFPAFTVNPLMREAALDELTRCKEQYGARVLKLHPWLQGFSASSDEMDAVAALCEKLDIIVIFHDGTPPYATPLQLARLCRDFPELVVVSGHAGLADLWRDAMLAARRYENYYLCLCGVHLSAMQTIVDAVAPEKLCAGSDANGSEAYEDVLWYRWEVFRKLRMSSGVRRVIAEETPNRLLGLS